MNDKVTPPPADLMALNIEQQARDLFAAELERDGIEFLPGEIRKPGSMLTVFEDRTIRAIKAALTRPSLSAQAVGDELPDDATNLEVIQFFIHAGRTMQPVGHWPGERLYTAIERVLNTPHRFIAEADMSPMRGHNGRGGDQEHSLPPYVRKSATPPQPADGGDRVGEAELAAEYVRGRNDGWEARAAKGERANRDRVNELIEAATEMNRLAKGPAGGVAQTDKKAIVARVDAALAKFQPAGGES